MRESVRMILTVTIGAPLKMMMSGTSQGVGSKYDSDSVNWLRIELHANPTYHQF